MAQGRGVWGYLRRGLLIAMLAWLVLTVVPVLLLRWISPLTSAFMLQARIEALRTGDRSYITDYRWVTLEHISPQAAIAVVASEDQTFPFNYGFDLHSIRSAVRAAEHGRRLRGASTIPHPIGTIRSSPIGSVRWMPSTVSERSTAASDPTSARAPPFSSTNCRPLTGAVGRTTAGAAGDAADGAAESGVGVAATLSA